MAIARTGWGASAGALAVPPAVRYPTPHPQPAKARLTQDGGVRPYPATTDRAAGLWQGCWRSSGKLNGCPGVEAAVLLRCLRR